MLFVCPLSPRVLYMFSGLTFLMSAAIHSVRANAKACFLQCTNPLSWAHCGKVAANYIDCCMAEFAAVSPASFTEDFNATVESISDDHILQVERAPPVWASRPSVCSCFLFRHGCFDLFVATYLPWPSFSLPRTLCLCRACLTATALMFCAAATPCGHWFVCRCARTGVRQVQ